MQKHTVCTRYSNDQVSQLNSPATRYIASLFACLLVCCFTSRSRIFRSILIAFNDFYDLFTTHFKHDKQGILENLNSKTDNCGFLISLVLCLTNTRINLKKMSKVNEWIDPNI